MCSGSSPAAMRPAAKALVASHAGDLRILISATNSFVTAPIAAAFGIPELIATEPAFQEAGKFSRERYEALGLLPEGIVASARR